MPTKKSTPKVHWEVDVAELPFCCGVSVIGDATFLECVKRPDEPYSWYAGEGLTYDEPQSFKQALAYQNGSYMIYTTIPKQTNIIAELKANDFKQLATFKNSKTRNMVTIWGRPRRLSNGSRNTRTRSRS